MPGRKITPVQGSTLKIATQSSYTSPTGIKASTTPSPVPAKAVVAPTVSGSGDATKSHTPYLNFSPSVFALYTPKGATNTESVVAASDQVVSFSLTTPDSSQSFDLSIVQKSFPGVSSINYPGLVSNSRRTYNNVGTLYSSSLTALNDTNYDPVAGIYRRSGVYQIRISVPSAGVSSVFNKQKSSTKYYSNSALACSWIEPKFSSTIGIQYPLQNTLLLCIDGTSISFGFGLSNFNQTFGVITAQLLVACGVVKQVFVCNTAVSGGTISVFSSPPGSNLFRSPWGWQEISKWSNSFQSKFLISEGGTNDLYYWATVVAGGASNGASSTFSNMSQLWRLGLQSGFNVVQSPILSRTQSVLSGTNFETQRQSLISSISAAAGNRLQGLSGVTYAGLIPPLTGSTDANSTSYFQDSVHPTAAGHSIMACAYTNAVFSFLGVNPIFSPVVNMFFATDGSTPLSPGNSLSIGGATSFVLKIPTSFTGNIYYAWLIGNKIALLSPITAASSLYNSSSTTSAASIFGNTTIFPYLSGVGNWTLLAIQLDGDNAPTGAIAFSNPVTVVV